MNAAEGVSNFRLAGIVVLFLIVVVGQASNGKAQSNPKPAANPQAQPSPSPAASIAQPTPNLTQITTDLDTLDGQLVEVKRHLLNDAEQQRIQAADEILEAELDTRGSQTQEILNALPSLPELQDLDSEWRGLNLRVNISQRQFLERASLLNADVASLDAQNKKWSQILAQIQSDPSLNELQTRVRNSLADINTTSSDLAEQLKATITLQTRLAQREQFVQKLQAQIDAEKTQIQRGLFQADSSPLWQTDARDQAEPALQRVLRRHLSRDWIRLREFIETNQRFFVLALVVFLLSLALTLKMRRNLDSWIEQDIVDSHAIDFIKRPYGVAYLIGLLTLFPLLPIAPYSARGVMAVLFIVPIIRLVGPLVTANERKLIYILIASLVVIQVCKVIAFSASFKRQLLALISIMIIGSTVAFARDSFSVKQKRSFSRSVVVLGIKVCIGLIFLSLLANVFGYFALSQVLSDVALYGAYYALLLYAAYSVLKAIDLTLLRTRTASRSVAIHEYQNLLSRWILGLLRLVAIIFWVISLLRLFTIRDDVENAIRRALSIPLSRTDTGFTGGDVVAFVAVLLLGILLAMVVRVVLREDVLRRLPVRHGVPFAVSTLTYYLLLLFVFFAALIAAGVELSKFTLFTGAFGIGIGFGLQNTISNFASGLILLFERPIRDHDILEVDGAFGEVTRIGMRSTSIRTAEEAEVIVPNSNLVAGKVINWSRLGRRRPVELVVHAVYGTDPELVVDLLVQTAAANSEVLSDPPPSAFLQKFGEKTMEFALVFWVARYHLDRRVLSEIAISVNKAFEEKGIAQR
jgi:small-conductance mechanosensitive channel